jgi:flagellin-like hook-associated protein FlgL
MDGTRIRELSATQRKLIDELVRAGFAATGLADPSAALRDDVTGTMQAAVADPEIAARLGTLTKAEQWSGFGEFGSTTAVAAPRRSAEREPEPEPPVAAGPTKAEVNAARRRRAVAGAEAEAAQQAHSAAVKDLDARKTKLNTARRRYEKLLESLTAAERELNAADADHGSAERTVQDAADRVETAKSALAEADSELVAVTARVSR